LALHGGNHPLEVDHRFSSANDFHGEVTCLVFAQSI
jgi:hypothetical protein